MLLQAHNFLRFFYTFCDFYSLFHHLYNLENV